MIKLRVVTTTAEMSRMSRMNVRMFSATMCTPQQTVAIKNSKGRKIETSLENQDFEAFYRSQKICPDHEFPDFLRSCRTGLPSVFRVILSRPGANQILAKLRTGYFGSAGLTGVPWYPDNNTWRFNRTRWDLKDDSEFKGVHRILDAWRNSGNIYRMEQVSMVPVACLDIQPHHKVLDMCSAPGSKTGQILEALQNKSYQSDTPSGFVIANEVDKERCRILASNMKLFSSPSILITNYRGESFPDLVDGSDNPVLYDRIVCDVPCSGDGTIRKNPNVWNIWNPGRGNHRYYLQLNIARRGIQLLKEGGLMAYSSCSINQIENECVIAQLLKEGEGSLELVDMTDKFPGLRFEPGLNSWQVYDTGMNHYQNYDAVPLNKRTQICPEMFATPSVNEKLKLDRCMRFLPHYNDDGGFFVAVLRKTRQFQGCQSVNAKMERLTKRHAAKSQNARNPVAFSVHDKFVGTDINFKAVKEYFGLEALCPENVMTWSGDQSGANAFFLVNNALRDIGRKNPELTAALMGTQILEKELRRSSTVPYKFTSESLHLLAAKISRRTISVDSKPDFLTLISQPELNLDQIPAAIGKQLKLQGPGHVLFRHHEFLVPGYSSITKLEMQIKTNTRNSLLSLLSD